MQFNFLYYLHMDIADFDNNGIKENEWLYSRLVKQKEDENKANEKNYQTSE